MVLTIGETQISFVDDYIENSVNPEWGYHAEFPMEQSIGTSMALEVWDYDRNKDDDFLGRCHLDLRFKARTEMRAAGGSNLRG